jgi:hypothetical protein
VICYRPNARSTPPGVADFIHRFFDGSFGFAGLLSLIPDLVVMATCYTSPILFPTSTSLLFCYLAFSVVGRKA